MISSIGYFTKQNKKKIKGRGDFWRGPDTPPFSPLLLRHPPCPTSQNPKTLPCHGCAIGSEREGTAMAAGQRRIATRVRCRGNVQHPQQQGAAASTATGPRPTVAGPYAGDPKGGEGAAEAQEHRGGSGSSSSSLDRNPNQCNSPS